MPPALALDADAAPTRESVLDAAGQVRSIIERDGAARFEQRRDYDPLRRLVRIVDPLGHAVIQNVYDLWGNRIRIAAADGGIAIFVFDGGSHGVQRTDADGRILLSSRDGAAASPNCAMVRPRRSWSATNTTAVRAQICRAGWRESVEISAVLNMAILPKGRKPDTAYRTGVPGTFETRFEYNGKRQVTRVVYPDGSSVDYNHSPSGMPQSIPGYIDAIHYGPTGLRERIRFANGLETRRRYTPGDYLINEVSTEQAGGGHRYQHLVYELDAVGQASRIDDLSTVPGKVRLDEVYAYDARNRLIRASGSVGRLRFHVRIRRAWQSVAQ